MKKNKLFTQTGKRVLTITLIAAMSVSVFGGCGKKASDKNENGQTVIKVGGWPSQEGGQLTAMNERKEKFENDNPDFVIEPDLWSFDLKSFYSKAAGNTLPTIFNCYFTEMPQIRDMEYSKELTKAFKDNGFEGKFNPKILEAVSDEDGNIYGLPYSAYMLGLTYNVDLFEKAGLMEADGTPKQPKTWDEVVEFAKIIKEKTGKPGMVFPSMTNFGGWMFMPIAWSYGVDFMEQDEDGNWKATFNSPQATAALQYIKDLKWKHNVLPDNTLIDGTEYYKMYCTGQAGMLISATGITNNARQYGMNPEHVGMMAMPAGPECHVTLLGGNVYCIANNSTDDQTDGALKWIKMSTTYEASEDFKNSLNKSIENSKKNNQVIGLKSLSIWNDNTESVKLNNEMIENNANINLNHVRLYNEFLESDVKIQPEEPVCAQELYAVLDNCIQEVWTNENADCTEVLKKANADFQSNYLDNIDY